MQNPLKATLLTLALGLSGAGFAQASAQTSTQPAAPVAAPQHQPNPQHQAKELAKKLALTPDQTAQLEPILADRDQKVATLAANTTLDPKAQRQQRRAIMVDTEQKLNAILSPDQQQQYAALKAKRKEHAQAIQAASAIM
jgi:Spy/CpxP family protein refolding chaperone